MADETTVGGQLARRRCFLCGARLWAPTERVLRLSPSSPPRRFRFACGSCGVLADAPEAGEAAAAHWRAAAREPAVEPADDDPYGFDAYSLRSAATRHDRWAEPADGAQAQALCAPHSELAARAGLADLRDAAPAPFSLAILCRESERPRAMALAQAARAWSDDILVLLDGEGAGEARAGLRVHRRPLAGDFSAQRNAAQALARHEWVLQLDSDETLDAAQAATLGPLLARLDSRTVSVGLRRRNLVDGAPADLWPDTQYRLNRRAVRYENRVHERPSRPWQRSLLHLGATIGHHLSRAHVEARSHRYEAMARGEGRLFEETDLLTPFQP